MESKNKVVMLGDASVGKTAFVSQLITHKVDEISVPTVGAAYSQHFWINRQTNQREKIEIWDTAGSELFRAMTPLYVRGAFGAFIVFDVTRKSTFENILEWKESLNSNIPVVVVGNKLDLHDKREVSTEEATLFCTENHLEYRETSALTGDGIKEAFDVLMFNAFKAKAEKGNGDGSGQNIDVNQTKSKGCC